MIDSSRPEARYPEAWTRNPAAGEAVLLDYLTDPNNVGGRPASVGAALDAADRIAYDVLMTPGIHDAFRRLVLPEAFPTPAVVDIMKAAAQGNHVNGFEFQKALGWGFYDVVVAEVTTRDIINRVEAAARKSPPPTLAEDLATLTSWRNAAGQGSILDAALARLPSTQPTNALQHTRLLTPVGGPVAKQSPAVRR